MRVVVFDTETSGLIANQTVKIEKLPEVIEFYGCVADLNSGKIEQELDILIKPRNGCKLEETKLQTITEEMVADKKPFVDHAGGIKSLLESAETIIGHNLSFDVEVIDVEMKRCGMKVNWPYPICTVEQTIHLKGFRLTLSQLYQHLFNEPFAGAHRAKADVMATLRCAAELYKRGDL